MNNSDMEMGLNETRIRGRISKIAWILFASLLFAGLLTGRYWQFHEHHPPPRGLTPVNALMDKLLIEEETASEYQNKSRPGAQKTSLKRPALAPIHLNLATVGQLALLPGIGLKKAQAIAKYRSEHGGFHSVDELDQVKGIGVKTLAKIKKYILIDP